MNFKTKSSASTPRDTNEDAFFIKTRNEEYVFAVADGIGGLKYGDKASKIAVSGIEKFDFRSKSIHEYFTQKNKEILTEGKRRNTRMGTTLALVKINTNRKTIQIAHIGDSRVYLFNDEIWHTKDHTLVQELVDMGILNESMAFSHPEKNRLNKALGIIDPIEIDFYETTINHSHILLSTDGLHDFVDDETILKIIMKESLEHACENLIKKARSNGSTDDISLILIQP
jgi:protein phosphatase